ncbi:MAG: CRISPR-associated helicase Cas3' [bacterium]
MNKQNNEPSVMLAKKPKNLKNIQYRETLLGHTHDVMNAFYALFGNPESPSRLLKKWLQFFKLDYENYKELFFLHGLPACILHDIGKSNSGFQEKVYSKGEQIIRHEHLSVLILWHPSIRNWFIKNLPELDLYILLYAIMGHHLKSAKSDFAVPFNIDHTSYRIYINGIAEVLQVYSEKHNLQLPDLSQLQDSVPDKDYIKEFTKEMNLYYRRVKRNPEKNLLICSIRSALIAADSAGSGLPREDKPVVEWIQEAFNEQYLLSGDDIENKVIQPRISEIRKKRKFAWKDFQNEAENLPDRALLLSSCGSGKTLAAWRWIKARTNHSPVSRVIFLYPTRGTATEGFRDYVSWAPEADAALIHSSSLYDLHDMFQNPDDERNKKDFTVEERLFALGYWNKRIFSATVDQFLGFMQCCYRSLCLIPLLVDSVIVVDEVHSFDKPLFSALKNFLISFHVPVLCMTASLPKNRREELLECGLQLYPDPTRHRFKDLQELENIDRYKVQNISFEKAKQIAQESLQNNKKILWVVNTVTRCQQLAMEFPDALCYHSRYRLKDRKEQHDLVVSKFKNTKSLMAITTQVCEMSLDLDADVLISEAAPIPSMIQRMGRCNRHATPKSNRYGEVYFYLPENIYPYKQDDLKGMSEFLDEIKGNASQLKLTLLLEKYSPAIIEYIQRYSTFLESGPWVKSGEVSLRDETDFTVQAILDRDILKYINEVPEKSEGYVVSVPKSIHTSTDSRLPSWLRVAPSSHYDERLGFLNYKQEIVLCQEKV